MCGSYLHCGIYMHICVYAYIHMCVYVYTYIGSLSNRKKNKNSSFILFCSKAGISRFCKHSQLLLKKSMYKESIDLGLSVLIMSSLLLLLSVLRGQNYKFYLPYEWGKKRQRSSLLVFLINFKSLSFHLTWPYTFIKWNADLGSIWTPYSDSSGQTDTHAQAQEQYHKVLALASDWVAQLNFIYTFKFDFSEAFFRWCQVL